MQADALKKVVLDALDDLKAQDVRVIDVHGVSDVTDIMIIASGTSNRQVGALADHVVEKAKEHGMRPLGIEGKETGEWTLVDLGDVVVHVMLPRVRDFYQLERLWSMPASNAEVAEQVEALAPRRRRFR